MKKYGIREAQINLTKLLKDEIPFAITRYGSVIAVVERPQKKKQAIAKASDLKKINTPKEAKVEITSRPKKTKVAVCKHGSMKGLCKYGCQ